MKYPKRRANLLYRLRKKGVLANTKLKVIYIPYSDYPCSHIQAIRLCREFHFNIQLTLV
ncbi:MAG: hypothetical protein NC095_06595 [Muribaculum sp.]|nr:hypothetical protein [Muribaculum sp.]